MTIADDIRAKAIEIIALADQIDSGNPTPSGAITFPKNNYVFHRSVSGPVSFTATKTGSGTFRVMNGSTVVQESTSGSFTNIPFGFLGRLELVSGSTVLHSVKFGVGYHYLGWGQSNMVRFKDIPNGDVDVFGTAEGKAIIGIQSEDGSEITYHDSYLENLNQGMSWIHMMNNLRARGTDPEGFSRNVPYCVTLCGQGGTNVQTFAQQPLLGKLTTAMALANPGAVFTAQGESNAEYGGGSISALASHYSTIINAANAVKNVTWFMNLCDHAHNIPSGGHYDIALAQESVVDAFQNVIWGIDISRMHKPYPLPQNVNRGHAEVHFFGARNKAVGDLMADRLWICRNHNV